MNIQANDSMGTALPARSPGARIISPGSFASAAQGRAKPDDANIFRDAWVYQITGNGKARLDSRSGASPAFLSVLDIAAVGPVSFRDIARRFDNIASDDLELWLSAMCSMDLLEPVAAPVSADDSTVDALADSESTAINAFVKGEAPQFAGYTSVESWKNAVGFMDPSSYEVFTMKLSRLIDNRLPALVKRFGDKTFFPAKSPQVEAFEAADTGEDD